MILELIHKQIIRHDTYMNATRLYAYEALSIKMFN